MPARPATALETAFWPVEPVEPVASEWDASSPRETESGSASEWRLMGWWESPPLTSGRHFDSPER